MKERLLGELRKLMVVLRRKKQGGKLFHPYTLPYIYGETLELWVIEVKFTFTMAQLSRGSVIQVLVWDP